MVLSRLVLAALLVAAAFLNIAIAQPNDINGSWEGSLAVQGANLRIIFNITTEPSGAIKATLDSPDQGANGIRVDTVIVAGDSVHLLLAALMGRYDGAVQPGDSLMRGTWRQAGMSWPLDLRRLKERFVLRRPQEPKPPLPYDREEVTVENADAGFMLAGSLTKPKTGGPFAAVVLITGSGPQDRDETVMGHRPFLVLSDYLTRRGIAVLRCDDRGVGKSKGKFAGATTMDFATDVESMVRYLSSRSDIRHDRIGLIGHSEGGIIAPLVASRNPGIAFIVMMAGPSIPGTDIILMQDSLISTANGASAEDVRKSLELNRKIFDILRTGTDSAKVERTIEDMVYAAARASDTAHASDEAMHRIAWLTATQFTSPWMRFFLFYDPMPALGKVKCPVLAINGEKDLQVPAVVNLNGIEKALKQSGNTDHAVRLLPGLNHLFQTAVTGSPKEYSATEETMSPLALQMIGDWVVAHTK